MNTSNFSSIYSSPIGSIKICASDNGITSIQFTEGKAITKSVTNIHITNCIAQLDEYFNKKRTSFTIKLDMQGTEFQTAVWKELQRIAFGKTCCYSDIARRINNPKACRAIGSANNKNPVAIVVPCHRVIGKNKKLVGYAAGLWRKEWLLKHEGVSL